MLANMIKGWSLLLLGAWVGGLGGPQLAEAHAHGAFNPGTVVLSETDSAATDFVRKKHEDLVAAMKAAADPKTDPKLLAVFDTMLDYEALSRDSLGTEWDGLTEAQRTDFSALLKQLVQNSYRKNLRDPADFAVQYLGAQAAAAGTVVKTQVQSRTNQRERPLAIDYLVGSTAQGLKIRDVVTDEVSLVANYRSQFKRMLKKRGFDGLIEQMRKQLEK